MPKRPRYIKIIQILIKHYGYTVRSRRGSHVWMADSKGHRTTVLASNDMVNQHNYKSILKQTGLKEEDIERYI
ncbi:MAG: type II toxin-antitoxin system HicA family toxin [Candidatus Micrarchaeota archaeon]|nr:type II toxin-antitoxin system HicA family toxin [Candidatus Micrarchaeota archaeon]